MSGRRENISKDRRRTSAARKNNHKAHEVRAKQQAAVLQRLMNLSRQKEA